MVTARDAGLEENGSAAGNAKSQIDPESHSSKIPSNGSPPMKSDQQRGRNRFGPGVVSSGQNGLEMNGGTSKKPHVDIPLAIAPVQNGNKCFKKPVPIQIRNPLTRMSAMDSGLLTPGCRTKTPGPGLPIPEIKPDTDLLKEKLTLLAQNMNDISVEFKLETEFDAVMAYYDKINCLWLWMTKKTQAKYFVKLMDELNVLLAEMVGQGKICPKAVELNQIVICPSVYGIDGAYFRGKVVAFDNSEQEATIFFVDYGNVEIVKYELLYHYPDAYSLLSGGLRFAASRCKMDIVDYGFQPASETARKEILATLEAAKLSDGTTRQQILSGTIVAGSDEYRVVNFDQFGSYNLKPNIADFIIDHGMGYGQPKLVGRSGVYVIPDMHEEKTVRLTGFRNAEVVYCWVNSEEFAKNIVRYISASLRERFMLITPEDRSRELTSPDPGSYAAVEVNGEFYRATVTSVGFDFTAQVDFIDFGPRNLTVSFEKMWPLLPEELLIPAMALPCLVEGIADCTSAETNEAAHALLFPTPKPHVNIRILRFHSASETRVGSPFRCDYADISITLEDGRDYRVALQAGNTIQDPVIQDPIVEDPVFPRA